MRVLFVTYGTSVAPATRYRVDQYLPYLRREGISCCCMSMISSLLTRVLIRSRGTGGAFRYLWIIVEQFIGFIRVALRARWYDIIYFQRAVFPFGLEKILAILNNRIIFDLDDAIYLPVEEERGFLGSVKVAMKKRQVVNILAVSKHCICENSYIKSFVEKHCNRISIITGPIDVTKKIARAKKRGRVIIGWIGSPASSRYLDILHAPLRKLAQMHEFQVSLVGVTDYRIGGIKIVSKEWRHETEAADLRSFDIGVCPMPDDPWTRGKTSVKILQYMIAGIPCIASYTPTNVEVVRDGVNGFLAQCEDEWVDKLSRLILDKNLRLRIGQSGRNVVKKRYSLGAAVPVLIEILKDVSREDGLRN